MRRRQRLLATGFGAFPGVPDNPTVHLMRWLTDMEPSWLPERLDVATAVLPVEWHAAPQAANRLIAAYDPDISLHFGAHRRATGFRIEQWARNETAPVEDAIGRKADTEHVLAHGPAALRAPLSAVALAGRLHSAGLPVSVSGNAGTYLCNAVYFHSLFRARAAGHPRIVLFVHVPAHSGPNGASKGPLNWDALRLGTRVLIDALSAEARPTPRPRVARTAVGALRTQDARAAQRAKVAQEPLAAHGTRLACPWPAATP